ncbi:MAG: type III ribulose-bisphosphate carboxylase [Candidatus Bathyarchaeota archaeon]|nr:type III ribulose-bisphosphate carboxylase [Candidatus Bathyarchaeota archaeon]
MVLRYTDFVDLDYKPKSSDLVCTFTLEQEGMTQKEAAGAIAAESSIGTWTELTTEKPYVKALAAKVFSLKDDTAKIAYPIELFEGGNMPNILSSVAGNVFGLKGLTNLRLYDIAFPKELAGSFKGPQYGIEGVRDLLQVPERPLVGTIIKPKLGLKTEDHARVAYEAWAGGCDIVKDDENLSSQDFNSFEARIAETMESRDQAEAETGEKKVYMANVTAETQTMLKRAQYVQEQGGRYIMVDILTCGWAALQTLRDQEFKLAIHAHRAGHAAFTKNPKHGISMQVIAKVARIIGVDQLHVGTVVGKMSETKKEVTENIKASKNKLHTVKPVFPVASGGLYPQLVPALLKVFGNDVIIQAGGGIHGHPNGTTNGAKAMRQAVTATLEGKTLKEYAKTHPELKAALDTWKT